MTSEEPKSKAKQRPITCGVVMPISAIDGCSAEHWVEVKNIIYESVESIQEPSFAVKLVSDADDVGVIQKRIVQNVYSSDILVCDVSGKNPNVMFELGMRLAFDKPTVIIKDDKTDYSFDTGIIEHVPYPRDLRFARVVSFKVSLADKVLATYRAAQASPEHSTFLKNFGKFQVANLAEAVVPADKLVLEMLQDLQSEVSRLRRSGLRDLGSKSSTAEGMAAIAAGLHSFRARNPSVTIIELIRSDEFYKEMEVLCEAPRFFMSAGQFREATEEVLKEALRIEDRTK